mgnify:CR=1 FL=1|jgi:hypothetical protein
MPNYTLTGNVHLITSSGRTRIMVEANCSCGSVFSIRKEDIGGKKINCCGKCGLAHASINKSINAGNRFRDKAVEVHGDRYDYSQVVYTKAKNDVTIVCKVHGEFTQTPDNHLQGKGCSSCAVNGFKMDIPAILYFFKIKNTYKIGVTNGTLEKRYNKTDRLQMSEITTWYFPTGREAYEYEQNIIKLHSNYKYTGVTPFTDGTLTTECFTININKE